MRQSRLKEIGAAQLLRRRACYCYFAGIITAPSSSFRPSEGLVTPFSKWSQGWRLFPPSPSSFLPIFSPGQTCIVSWRLPVPLLISVPFTDLLHVNSRRSQLTRVLVSHLPMIPNLAPAPGVAAGTQTTCWVQWSRLCHLGGTLYHKFYFIFHVFPARV